MSSSTTNPFRFGALALDEAFADREGELAELTSDIRNGQDVVVFAPRRCGKSSLVWRAARKLAAEGVLVAQVDLMTTPTKESLAARARDVDLRGDRLAAGAGQGEGLAPFRGLQMQPTMTRRPRAMARSRFCFGVGRRPADIDATLERLLELPAELGAERGPARRR